MAPKKIIEGTGEEIAKYASAHPNVRFELFEAKEDTGLKGGRPGHQVLEEIEAFKESLKGKMGPLPLEATSTDALYD